jgi:quinol monooxygenase YgiN
MQRIAVLALLAACCLVAQAARMPDLALMHDDLPEDTAFMGSSGVALSAEAHADLGDAPLLEGGFTAGSYATDLESLVSEQDALDKSKWPIRIATKHLVRPESHGSFVRQFWRLQYKSRDIKGLKYLSLAKVAGDNLVWTSYAVYEDFEALIKHARSEGVRDFATYLTTTNVPVSTKLLVRIAGGYHGKRATAVNELAAAAPADVATAAGKKKEWPIRLLTAYVVRPGEHCGFVKAWKKMESKVADSKGLVSLTLNKPAGNNILFTSYAHFDSPKGLWALHDKKAVKDFFEYVSDNHITVVTKKLWKIPEPKW